MLPLLLRLLRRVRPREGWLILLLVFIGVLCPPAALVQITRAPGAGRLLWLSGLAALAGLALARSRISGRAATLVGAVLGVGLIVVVIGGLVPPVSLLWSEAGYAVAWVRGWLHGAAPATPPLAATAGFIWQRWSELAGRLGGWGLAVSKAGPVQDQIGFMLLMALLTWVLGCVATWQVYRRRAALAGMLPSGAGVAIVSFLSGGGRTFVILYLLCTLALLAAMNFWNRRQRWEQTGTDYPGDLGVDVGLVVLPWLLVVVAVAAFFPHIRSREVSRAFWQVLDRPWSAVENVTVRIFGDIESRYPGGFGTGDLPQEHLLSAGPNLAKTTVMYVTTSDPPPPPEDDEPRPPLPSAPRRYWRGIVYDVYTGHGWVESQLQGETYRDDQPLGGGPPPGTQVEQKFQVVRPTGRRLYAVNAPLSIDQPVTAYWRVPGDLAYLEGSPKRYAVVSRAPEPTVRDLRAAPATLPPDVAQRYLALPDTLPRRVRDLAEQVTAGAATRYDQAKAIESYVRTYTYTLDVPLPPATRDVADYFLFDLKKGYCDYYATAMVVMARAVGIPARFASGYAQGTYDYQQQRWVVTELDGHSWAEIYFEGIGWVEFEPTAGQPPLDRPAGSASGGPAVPTPAPIGLMAGRAVWPLLIAGLVLALLVGVVAAIWWPRKSQAVPATELARDRYERLVRWGGRLGRPPDAGQTPFEYGAALGSALHTRGSTSRWARAREAADRAPAEIEELAGSFVRAQYAPRPLEPREGQRVIALWDRLRRHLLSLLLR